MEMDLSIVSGTYNRLDLLRKMVAGVRTSIRDLSYEFVLVDGGSTDGTIEWCKSQDDIVLIEQGQLLGAVKAFNAGCETAQGEFVVILNDDIEVRGDTVWRSWKYLHENPHVGQVAYRNHPVDEAKEPRSAFSHSYGFLYGQCCITRRWLGDWAGWWGEGYHTYGGDSHLGMRLWELGWPVHSVNGCGITDRVCEDELRRLHRKQLRPGGPGTPHVDTGTFVGQWSGRLPKKDRHIPVQVHRLTRKAANGELRTLRFRFVYPGASVRMAQYNAFRRLGPSKHLSHCELIDRHGVDGFQQDVIDVVESFRPDITIFQAHSPGNVQPDTVRWLRAKFPEMYFVNFDGDFHRSLQSYHFEIAKAVHLQELISPDLFPVYAEHGAYNLAWSFPAYEEEYEEVQRPTNPTGPIVFLVNRTPPHVYPEAQTRIDAVVRLHESGLPFKVYGTGWSKFGIQTTCTSQRDERGKNADIYANARMAVSISQAKHLYGYTSNRAFFAGATGCPILMQRFNGMEDMGYVDEETVIGWDTLDELVDKASYYLKHQDGAEEIGRQCRRMTLSRHNYDVRIRHLIVMLEGL